MKSYAQRLAFIGLAAISAQLWGQSKNIRENVDPYSGLRTLYLEVATRTCPGDPPVREHDPEVHLLLTAAENRDGSVAYFVTPELDGGSPLNVHAKGTMDILIEGNPAAFTTPMGSTVTTQYDGGHSYLHETVPFLVSNTDLYTLSGSNWLQFRVNGPRQAVQRCVDAKHLRDVPEFLGAAAQYASNPQNGAGRPGAAPQAQRVVETVNASTHLKDLKLGGIATQACAGDPALGPQDADVGLTISANQRTDGGVWYFVTTDLANDRALNVPRGGTIETKIDGQTAVSRTINGSVLSSGSGADRYSVRETTAFHVHQTDLVALSEASKVEFLIKGANRSLRRCVDPKSLQDLPQFIDASTTLYDHSVADARQP